MRFGWRFRPRVEVAFGCDLAPLWLLRGRCRLNEGCGLGALGQAQGSEWAANEPEETDLQLCDRGW